MKNGTEQYIETVKYLSKLYDFLNENFFKSELEKPVITIQRDERNKTNGWFSIKEVWFKKESADSESAYELNITAQKLNRSVNEIAETLLHEMCHQYASVNGFQDTSNNGNYHNRLFKRIAEVHGLVVKQVAKIGWAQTSLTAESEKLISAFIENNPETIIYRSPVLKGQTVKTLNSIKYKCPCCGNSVRATKEVNISCVDCNELMLEEI